jgi:hypothetical protein
MLVLPSYYLELTMQYTVTFDWLLNCNSRLHTTAHGAGDEDRRLERQELAPR